MSATPRRFLAGTAGEWPGPDRRAGELVVRGPIAILGYRGGYDVYPADSERGSSQRLTTWKPLRH